MLFLFGGEGLVKPTVRTIRTKSKKQQIANKAGDAGFNIFGIVKMTKVFLYGALMWFPVGTLLHTWNVTETWLKECFFFWRFLTDTLALGDLTLPRRTFSIKMVG